MPDLVGTVDIAPTLIELTGARRPAGMEGESFLSLLSDEGASLGPRLLYQEFRRIVGVRTERWKYFVRPYGEPELYDLRADPEELSNCVDDYPDVVEELDAATTRAIELRGEIGKMERVVVDPETVEALRALGYM